VVKLKRFFAMLIALCMFLCTGAFAEAGPVTPLLYEVTDDDGNVIWLFGSIHFGEEWFYPLPDYVYDAYDSADALAVEFDILAYSEDIVAQINSATKLLYDDGTTVDDHLSPETYQRAVQILTDAGQYVPGMEVYKLCVWWSALDTLLYETLGADAEMGIDMHMLNKAHEENKPVIDIESPDFQMELLSSFSDELNVLLLEQALAMFDDPQAKSSYIALLLAWASGEEKMLVQLLQSEADALETDEERALYAEYEKALMTDRNNSMSDFAENALKDGEKLFICVGAAHVVGETGIAAQLAERGYSVTVLGGNAAE